MGIKMDKSKKKKSKGILRRMFSSRSLKKPFDTAIESHSPHYYDDGFEQIYLEEDYCTAKTVGERKKILADFVKYWDGFKKYLHERDIGDFDESIKKIKDMDFSNFEYPSIYVTFSGTSGHKVEVKLSAYSRLFAEVKIGMLPDFGKPSVAVVKKYLSRYISNWNLGRYNAKEMPQKGYGRNIHLLWDNDGVLYFCTAFEEHDENSGEITSVDIEYRWLYKIIKIATDIANERYDDFETYLPAEYKKFINSLKLEYKTITGVMNNNAILDCYKDRIFIEMDGKFTLSFDDGRIIGFSFGEASHPSVDIMDDWDVLDIPDRDGEKKSSEIFKDLIGAKITKINIITSKNVDDMGWAYWNLEWDETKQDEYIIKLQLVLDDKNVLAIEPGEDWTNVSLTPIDKQ